MQLTEKHLFYVVLTVVAVIFVARFLRWLFSGPVQTDPWGELVEMQIESPDSMPICHRCFAECEEHLHFCPQCGTAVGEFNNLLPYERLFSIGEVLRNGTTQQVSRSVSLVFGYFLLSLATYSLFAPVYWFFLLRNFFRLKPIQDVL